ncbi:acyl--CoA ligase [Actinomadura madurae]
MLIEPRPPNPRKPHNQTGIDSQTRLRRDGRLHTGDLENAIRTCPGVADVGVPDRTRGERVAAAVVGTCTPEDVHRHCRTRVADPKRPDHVVIVERLPLTPPVGKPDRNALIADPDRTRHQVISLSSHPPFAAPKGTSLWESSGVGVYVGGGCHHSTHDHDPLHRRVLGAFRGVAGRPCPGHSRHLEGAGRVGAYRGRRGTDRHGLSV